MEIKKSEKSVQMSSQRCLVVLENIHFLSVCGKLPSKLRHPLEIIQIKELTDIRQFHEVRIHLSSHLFISDGQMQSISSPK